MARSRLHRSAAALKVLPGLLALLLLPGRVAGQTVPAVPMPTPAPSPAQTLTLTLEEALQIALVNNYTLRNSRLDVENADAQVREAWGQVMPQVNASSSYTRNLKSANPFAGSSAGGLFGSLGYIDWLSYNERARTDDDASTAPISFGEYQDRRQAGLDESGIGLGGSDNPFAVANQFQSGISIEQTLFNGSAFAAIAGAEQLKDINRRALDRQQQTLIDQVRQTYYQALLAQRQAQVATQSVTRTQETLDEVARSVAQGVTPKFQRLSAEVELANLQTQLVQTQNQAQTALDNLKFTLGIPIVQPIRLRGDLEAEDQAQYLNVSAENAFSLAFERRPDLEQARLAIELNQINKRMTRSRYYPTVSAFANLNYTGSVPDDRSNVITDPEDPFSFSSQTSGFFSQSYWNPSVNVGLSLSWNIFNGFQTSALLQQRQVAVDQAQIDYEQLVQSVYLEVESALRNLEAARQRIGSQQQNVERAELNYEYAEARLREGVSSQLELRDASQQLDQSRLNYLQAVYDYLVARSDFETAVGMPLGEPIDVRLTSN